LRLEGFASEVLTAKVCAHVGGKFVRRTCGQRPQPQPHRRAHLRGSPEAVWSPRRVSYSRASRPAPQARSVEERTRRGSLGVW